MSSSQLTQAPQSNSNINNNNNSSLLYENLEKPAIDLDLQTPITPTSLISLSPSTDLGSGTPNSTYTNTSSFVEENTEKENTKDHIQNLVIFEENGKEKEQEEKEKFEFEIIEAKQQTNQPQELTQEEKIEEKYMKNSDVQKSNEYQCNDNKIKTCREEPKVLVEAAETNKENIIKLTKITKSSTDTSSSPSNTNVKSTRNHSLHSSNTSHSYEKALNKQANQDIKIKSDNIDKKLSLYTGLPESDQYLKDIRNSDKNEGFSSESGSSTEVEDFDESAGIIPPEDFVAKPSKSAKSTNRKNFVQNLLVQNGNKIDLDEFPLVGEHLYSNSASASETVTPVTPTLPPSKSRSRNSNNSNTDFNDPNFALEYLKNSRPKNLSLSRPKSISNSFDSKIPKTASSSSFSNNSLQNQFHSESSSLYNYKYKQSQYSYSQSSYSYIPPPAKGNILPLQKAAERESSKKRKLFNASNVSLPSSTSSTHLPVTKSSQVNQAGKISSQTETKTNINLKNINKSSSIKPSTSSTSLHDHPSLYSLENSQKSNSSSIQSLSLKSVFSSIDQAVELSKKQAELQIKNCLDKSKRGSYSLVMSEADVQQTEAVPEQHSDASVENVTQNLDKISLKSNKSVNSITSNKSKSSVVSVNSNKSIKSTKSTSSHSSKASNSSQTSQKSKKKYDQSDINKGVVFLVDYLGSTQITAPNRTITEADRQNQAQLAVSRVKQPHESQPKIEVQLFISTNKFKIVDTLDNCNNVDDSETIFCHPLHQISYIADIGDLLVAIAKRPSQEAIEYDESVTFHDYQEGKVQRLNCHVFQSKKQTSQDISCCIWRGWTKKLRFFFVKKIFEKK